jgi:signal transduction histidine kinase
LIKDHDLITLIVEDDGKGFDTTKKKASGKRRGMGLMNMKERAESLHATLSLSSKRGEGTEIIVQLEEKKL